MFAYFNDVVGHRMCDVDAAGEAFSGLRDLPLAKKLLALKEVGLSSPARNKKTQSWIKKL